MCEEKTILDKILHYKRLSPPPPPHFYVLKGYSSGQSHFLETNKNFGWEKRISSQYKLDMKFNWGLFKDVS